MSKNDPGTGTFVDPAVAARMTFLDMIGLGLVNGHTIDHKFGFNAEVGTTQETIWDGSGIYVYPDNAGEAMSVASSDANDTALGTGARTVEVFGLDANFDEFSEVITLDGQTPVLITGICARLFRMRVLTAGSGAENAGTLYTGNGTFTAGVPANVFAQCQPGNNQTLMCLATVPRAKTMVVHAIFANTGTGKDGIVETNTRPFESVFGLERVIILSANTFSAPNEIGFVLPEKTDVEFRAINTQAGNIDVAAGFDFYLRPNDVRP